jgi:hypothetical protein
MSQRNSSRLCAVLGVGIAVTAGLGLLLAFLGHESSAPTPTTTPVIPTPSDNPVVVSIDGHPIGYSSWMEAVLLDQVMSGLAGQTAPTPDETLQRLINEELVLQTVPPEQEQTKQIEARIAALEQAWGVDDAAVVMALEEVGLTHTAFEQTVGRLLAVQAGLEALQGQGYDTATWLEGRRASAEIVLNEEFENLAVPALTSAQSPIARLATSPIPTAMPAAETPTPTPALVLPEVALDFALERASGGALALSEQLAQGPVVLVFFQTCG